MIAVTLENTRPMLGQTDCAQKQSSARSKSKFSYQAPNIIEILNQYYASNNIRFSVQNIIKDLMTKFEYDSQYLIHAFGISFSTFRRWQKAQNSKPNFQNYRKIYSFYCLAKYLKE